MITIRSDVTVKAVRTSAMDYDVTQAARVSTLGAEAVDAQGSTRGLINFLMRDRHGSPFEHNSFSFYIEAPIFVAREFFRHRAGWSYNEESGRYKELNPVFYLPPPERKLVQTGKPGAYTFEAGTDLQWMVASGVAKESYRHAWSSYQVQLRAGVAREVARNVLPVGIYTSFFATCNARSLMHFLSLRTSKENSKVPSFPLREIEMVAEQMEAHFAEQMPVTHAAFEKHGRVAP
ncbi:FAD-dependent thymidylate synthase [Streptomyces sp. NPDC057939]|uniref:FAD-dependent thymidylate synthase n=1 Tax=Streptomyces sp. NPDC057939 TaxID=3346284 RepID=UPI0036E181C4